MLLAADDQLLPRTLEVSVKQLNVQPECDFVSGHIQLITANRLSLFTPPQVLHQPRVKRDNRGTHIDVSESNFWIEGGPRPGSDIGLRSASHLAMGHGV